MNTTFAKITIQKLYLAYDSIDAYSSEQIFQVVSVEKYIPCIIFVAKIEILIVWCDHNK